MILCLQKMRRTSRRTCSAKKSREVPQKTYRAPRSQATVWIKKQPQHTQTFYHKTMMYRPIPFDSCTTTMMDSDCDGRNDESSHRLDHEWAAETREVDTLRSSVSSEIIPIIVLPTIYKSDDAYISEVSLVSNKKVSLPREASSAATNEAHYFVTGPEVNKGDDEESLCTLSTRKGIFPKD